MATPFSYTVPNWREGQPNAAELAIYQQMMTPQMGGSGGLGIVLGNELAANRHINERNYLDELGQQHVFAQQQADRHAAAQTREDLLKLIGETKENAGTLGLAYNNPILRPLLAGTDEGMMAQHAMFTKQQNDAKAYEAAGKGYREFREGGGYTAPGVIANMLQPAGVEISDTEPTAVTAARERAAEQGIGSVGGNPNTRHGGVTPSLKIVRRTKPDGTLETEQEAIERTLNTANSRSPINRPMITPQRSPASGVLPQATPPTSSAPPAPLPAQSQSQTTDAPGGAIPGMFPPFPPPGQTSAPILPIPGPGARLEVAPSGTPGKAEAQRAAANAIARMPADKRQLIVRRMAEINGDVPVAFLPGTGWVLVGVDGYVAEIPGFTRPMKVR